jgi:uncharacterized protein (DUF2147 family)
MRGKRQWKFILGAAILASGHARASTSLNGEWARDDGTVRARIGPCGKELCAITTWVKNPAGMEKIGDKFSMNVKEVAPRHWTGAAFDQQRNLRYSVDVQMIGDRLTTRGCVSESTACVTADWTRATR